MEAVYFGNANGGLNHGGAGNIGPRLRRTLTLTLTLTLTPTLTPTPTPNPNLNRTPNLNPTPTPNPNPNSTPHQARGRGSWQTWRTRCGAPTR